MPRTKEQMLESLKSMGVQKQYKPYTQPESDVIFLETRKPLVFTDGVMTGTVVSVYDSDAFEVWTSRTALATKLAKEHDLKIIKLDGEAILHVPIKLEFLLKKFGVKIKKQVSEETLARLAKIRPNTKSGEDLAL